MVAALRRAEGVVYLGAAGRDALPFDPMSDSGARSAPSDAATHADPSNAAGDPAAELLELVQALGAHTRRRTLLGVRRAPANAAAKQDLGPTKIAHPAVTQAPTRAGLPRAPTPFRPAAANSPGPVASGELDVSARAARNRARAADCADLASLRIAVAECTACELCKTRQQTVFSDGDGSAGVLFVGEAPGQHEDEQGVPFVGAAGQLLSDIIHKGMRLERSRTAIVNVLKCRPPGNREPTDQEKALCTPWLDRQVELLAPRVVVALGRHAANHVLGYAGAARRTLGSLRGQVHERGGRKVVATYHPSNLLREPDNKKECWKDIQIAMRELGVSTPVQPAKSE